MNLDQVRGKAQDLPFRNLTWNLRSSEAVVLPALQFESDMVNLCGLGTLTSRSF